MSLNISLIEYKTCKDGKLYEEGSEVIESAFLSPDLLEIIKDQFPLCKKEIFEEEGSPETSTIDIFSDNSIHEIKELLEIEFVRMIEASQSQKLTSVIIPNSIFEAIEKFRTLTNVYHIFWLKYENFSKRSNAIIKIG